MAADGPVSFSSGHTGGHWGETAGSISRMLLSNAHMLLMLCRECWTPCHRQLGTECMREARDKQMALRLSYGRELHNRTFPRSMFQTAQGPAYCSLSARTNSSFPDWKLVHPREADTGLTPKVLSLLCQACPLSLCWELSTVRDF